MCLQISEKWKKSNIGRSFDSCHWKGNSAPNSNRPWDEMYWNSSPSMATVKNWSYEFHRGRPSAFDESHPSAPKMATAEDNMTKVLDLAFAGHQMKTGEIDETVEISKDGMSPILHEILCMKKLLAPCVPRLIILDS